MLVFVKCYFKRVSSFRLLDQCCQCHTVSVYAYGVLALTLSLKLFVLIMATDTFSDVSRILATKRLVYSKAHLSVVECSFFKAICFKLIVLSWTELLKGVDYKFFVNSFFREHRLSKWTLWKTVQPIVKNR